MKLIEVTRAGSGRPIGLLVAERAAVQLGLNGAGAPWLDGTSMLLSNERRSWSMGGVSIRLGRGAGPCRTLVLVAAGCRPWGSAQLDRLAAMRRRRAHGGRLAGTAFRPDGVAAVVGRAVREHGFEVSSAPPPRLRPGAWVSVPVGAASAEVNGYPPLRCPALVKGPAERTGTWWLLVEFPGGAVLPQMYRADEILPRIA